VDPSTRSSARAALDHTEILLYQLWYDLEPHTTGADGDIDVKDVQFVFGRFGSKCSAPIPPQTPQSPVDP
jgi:hypothetical protein